MKSRWYIGTFFIALSLLLGFANLQTSKLPNQVIVIQVQDEVVNSPTSDSAILLLERQLQIIGVDNIRISDVEDGQISITYHSNIEVEKIKQKLSREKFFLIDFSSIEYDNKGKSNNDQTSFNLDIYEIQSDLDNDTGLDGKCAINPKFESKRLSDQNKHLTNIDVEVSGINHSKNSSFLYNGDSIIIFDINSYKIPEVRAGPNA